MASFEIFDDSIFWIKSYKDFLKLAIFFFSIFTANDNGFEYLKKKCKCNDGADEAASIVSVGYGTTVTTGGFCVTFSRTTASVMTSQSDKCCSRINKQRMTNTHNWPLLSRLQFNQCSIRFSSNQLINSITSQQLQFIFPLLFYCSSFILFSSGIVEICLGNGMPSAFFCFVFLVSFGRGNSMACFIKSIRSARFGPVGDITRENS